MWTLRLTLVLLFALAGCASGVRPLDTAEPEAGGAAPPVAAVQRLDDYLGRLEPLGFSGAVVVERGGEVVLRQGYGLADREAHRLYTPETVQSCGSITKQVTAAAILLLESRGRLAVSDPLSKHLPDVPVDKDGITLHHLLTHSAGLPSSLGPDSEPIGADELARRAMAAPLVFEPGTGYGYSNVGYALLGIVVERASGRDYEHFLRDELLLPAGLAETGYLLPGWDEERLAVGYLDGERWGRVHRREWREDGPGWHLRANGGLHTTVDDMRRWGAVLRGDGPLPAAAVERWTTGYVDEGGGDSFYAYGWAVEQTELGPMVSHNGGNGVFSADFVWLPDAELLLYIQGNTSLVYPADMRDALLGALFDPDFVVPPRIAVDPAAAPGAVAAHEGEYAVDGGGIALSADHMRLIAAVRGQPVLDAVFGHEKGERERFARLNRRAMNAMARLQAGREDAFEGLVGADEDAAARARSMLDAIARGGELTSVTLVGSVANAPGGRFAADGPWTTFFRAEHGGESWAWSVLWREDETYRGTAIGPPSDLPSLVMVPAGDGAFTGVEREPPWRLVELGFDDEGCLVAARLRACR